jgi:hypothetical protein
MMNKKPLVFYSSFILAFILSILSILFESAFGYLIVLGSVRNPKVC